MGSNRGNSHHSSGGPSRCHALKSGINAKVQVIPGEDPAELEAMAAGYHEDWQPTTYLERFLVDALIRAEWQLQRLARLEAELWANEMEKARAFTFSPLNEKAPIGDVYHRNCDRFTRLQRRIDSTERSYYRALNQLQRLRASRDAEPEALGPAPDPRPLAPQRAPTAKLGSFSHPVEPAQDPAPRLQPPAR